MGKDHLTEKTSKIFDASKYIYMSLHRHYGDEKCLAFYQLNLT